MHFILNSGHSPNFFFDLPISSYLEKKIKI